MIRPSRDTESTYTNKDTYLLRILFPISTYSHVEMEFQGFYLETGQSKIRFFLVDLWRDTQSVTQKVLSTDLFVYVCI